jgi:hypothetical protein
MAEIAQLLGTTKPSGDLDIKGFFDSIQSVL